ncbi:MAG: M3 family metallopeptidase [Vicinamibacterales bacterium]
MGLSAARAYFDQLNRDYIVVHRTKEDLFWATHMALSDDDAGFARAERAFKAFISDPERLATARSHIDAIRMLQAGPERDALLHGLHGWAALFESHIIESDEGRQLMHDIVEFEAALFAKRRRFSPMHVNEQGEEVPGTLGALATNLMTNPVEARRRSSFDGLRHLEQWVLDNGFLELVGLRNRFARALGAENYFDMKLRKNERMTVPQLFAIIDDFIARTEPANERSIEGLRAMHGDAVLEPWNFRFFGTGDVTRRMDEYLSFGSALRRWVDSFKRLGISFHGATLQLDLLDRPHKYQNGFCHAPLPTWFTANGEWMPGQINFTSNAQPTQVGSGSRAMMTLFHEGGHAAHFANVAQNAPCFSQEYAPTSMAYAETQSMFCDSLLDDADWLKRYATNAQGDVMPDDLIRDHVLSRQGTRIFDMRTLAVVPCFESALYAMTDTDRTRESVLNLARATERRVVGIESPRPLLAIPHLLNQESAAAYQGYLLAEMAVAQTRAYFLRRDGYLTDNPRIGPSLREQYWVPGNSIDHDTTLRNLTGEGFSARYLANDCNQSAEDAWQSARKAMDAAASRPVATVTTSLNASIRVVNGADVLADSSQGDEAMCAAFESWIQANYPAGS